MVIGTSGGGLEAVSLLLDGLHDDVHQPIVVAQHRSAESDSGLARLLGLTRAASSPTPTTRRPLERDHVYISPPDYHVLVEDGHLALSTDAPVQYARPSVDVLFESVADEYGPARGRHRADGRERRWRRGARTYQGPGRRRDRARAHDFASPHDARRRDCSHNGGRDPPPRRDPRLPLRTLRMSMQRASLLLVDDRRENLLALEAILEPLGHRLVSVTSGIAALKELLLGDFACILLDVQMPEIDGFELATLIKQRERSQHIPIIFLTALSRDEKHVYQGYSAGAVDYILKPIDSDVLRSKVSVFVELWEKGEQIQMQAEQIHEQKLDALERASEERYRQLADAMPQIVWTADATGAATYFNRRWFEYTGMTPEDVGPNAWYQVVHPDDLPAAVARREHTLRSGETFEVEYRFRGANGRYRWHLGAPCRYAIPPAPSASGSEQRPTSTIASASRNSARSSSPPAIRSPTRSTTARPCGRLQSLPQATSPTGALSTWWSPTGQLSSSRSRTTTQRR